MITGLKDLISRVCVMQVVGAVSSKARCLSAILDMDAQSLRALPRKHDLARVRCQTRRWVELIDSRFSSSIEVELHFCREDTGVS